MTLGATRYSVVATKHIILNFCYQAKCAMLILLMNNKFLLNFYLMYSLNGLIIISTLYVENNQKSLRKHYDKSSNLTFYVVRHYGFVFFTSV